VNEEWKHGEKGTDGDIKQGKPFIKKTQSFRETFGEKSAEELFRGEEITNRRPTNSKGLDLTSGVSVEWNKVQKEIHIPNYFTVYQITDPSFFRHALEIAQKTNEHGAQVALREVEEYKNAKLFLAENGATGIAVDPDGHIFSLFKNVNVCKELGIDHVSAKMIFVALSHGGKKLDCFDGFLPNLYSTFGFEAVTKIRFYPELTCGVPWNYERDGRPDLIFMKHNGDPIDKIIDNMGFYKKYDASAVTYSPDMESAEKKLAQALITGKQKQSFPFGLTR
jgi:hypothetical protein